MTKCAGIKNSVCDQISGSTFDIELDPNDARNRFTFVDLRDGLWSLKQVETYKNNPIIECPLGGSVVFHYPNHQHDVAAMVDEEHYKRCDFKNSSLLSPLSISEDHDTVTYYYHCTTPGHIDYISCSIPGHCELGQKVKIRTSSTIKTRDEMTGDWIIHSSSLERVMRLMGRSFDNPHNFLVLDRGYQTEALANQTLQWIWCGLDHCPSFEDLSPEPSQEDCEGSIYTLMGFVYRKRPIPQYDKAEHYYDLAIKTGGINECAARSYMTKMHLSKEDYESATVNANQLCEICGNIDGPFGSSVRQAKYEFDILPKEVNVGWPTVGPCALLDPSTLEDISSNSFTPGISNNYFFALTIILTFVHLWKIQVR